MKPGVGCFGLVAAFFVVGVSAILLQSSSGTVPGPGVIQATATVPTVARLRERFTLDFVVSAQEGGDIRQLEVRINQEYMRGMVVIETTPLARRDEDGATRHFYFGPLPQRTTKRLRITVVPTRLGDFHAVIRFAEAEGRGGPTILRFAFGPAELRAATNVAP